jgi:acyl-CoA reductase-like NAD-dependent aldehyde dehydrogenase
MIDVVEAYDRKPLAELVEEDEAALDRKLDAAVGIFADRAAWLSPAERIAVLDKLGALMLPQRGHFGMQIAREGGKPLTDALIEVDRAIDGVRNAAEMLRTSAGREVPMGITAASLGRRAFTIFEPIGVQ